MNDKNENEIEYPEVNFTEGIARNTVRFLTFKADLESDLMECVR